MKIIALAQRLVEDNTQVNAAQDYLDRVLLRICGSPSLLAYLDNAVVVDDSTVEVIVHAIPADQFQLMKQLLDQNNVKIYEFKTPNQTNKQGFRVSNIK